MGGKDEYIDKAHLYLWACGYVHQSEICSSNWSISGTFVFGACLSQFLFVCLSWGGNLGEIGLSLLWWLRAVLEGEHGEEVVQGESL